MTETTPITTTTPAAAGMSRALTLLFAVAGGAAVGNLYWAQPLLDDIAGALHVSTGSAGLLVTVTQVGYALGVFLVVPLGDTLNRRRLIPAAMAASAIALAASGLAPSYPLLLMTLALVGVTTIAGQLLSPLAGDLARDDQRGRVVGTVVSGMLTGILISRTVSGLVADALGWRAIFLLAAVVTAGLSILLARTLPAVPARATTSYLPLLRSVFSAVARYRAAQVTLVIGSLAMGVFSLFWTALTFLLSSAPYDYSVTQIGLVGLVGLAGALTAQRAGRLHDRGLSVPAAGAAIALAIVSLIVAGLGSHTLLAVLAGVLLLDIAIQATNVLNQTRLFSLDPQARSRLNTAFVTGNFIGGAIGSALASILWATGGWTAVMTGGVTLLAVALVVWLLGRAALDAR
jgi:predicted MFS family arabinose efflux permease